MGLVGTLALFQMRKALSPEKRKWLYVYLVVHLFAHAGAMDNYLIMYDVRIFPLYPYGLYMILPYVVLGSIAVIVAQVAYSVFAAIYFFAKLI